MDGLKISIASGKGGTGKTTLATNLAYYLAWSGHRVVYADGDVEEPNGHLFLKPDWQKTDEVAVKIPKIIEERCDFCGECSSFCEYNALAVLADKVLLFPSLCHSCGGCALVCPQDAIEEIDRPVGVINSGPGFGVSVFEGRLNVGEAIAVPVISALKKRMNGSGITIIDAPPGTSCPVVEAVRDTDFVILVTEPTPFGLNDLILAVGMVRKLNLPFGVIINRNGIGFNRVHSFCKNQRIDIIAEIPDDPRVARAYSKGEMIVRVIPEYRGIYESMTNNILRLISEAEQHA